MHTFHAGAPAVASVLEKKGQGECLPRANPALRLGKTEAPLAQASAVLNPVRSLYRLSQNPKRAARDLLLQSHLSAFSSSEEGAA